VGNFIAGRIGPALGRLESLFCSGYTARSYLRALDRGCLAAKRRGGGLGGRFWRRGQPDGIRAARRGHVSLEGDHLVRDHVYADVHGADNAHKHVRAVGRQFRVAAILEVAQAGGATGTRFLDSFACNSGTRAGSTVGSGFLGSCSGSAEGPGFIDPCAGNSGADVCANDSSSGGACAV
jgi:hypothetical protein